MCSDIHERKRAEKTLLVSEATIRKKFESILEQEENNKHEDPEMLGAFRDIPISLNTILK